MKVTYQALLKTFKAMKDDGIPKEDASDALELDSDQEVESEDVNKAITEVFGG